MNYSSGAMTFSAISCWANGQCAAGGSYFDASGAAQAFVDVETNGVWGEATEIAGSNALNAGATSTNNGATVNTVSARSPTSASWAVRTSTRTASSRHSSSPTWMDGGEP